MNLFQRYFPWAMTAIGAFYIVFFFVPRDEAPEEYQLSAFGDLPVLDHGRMKPMDTVARVTLAELSGGRQTWTDNDDNMQPAIRWLTDTMSGRFFFEKARAEGMEERALVINDEEIVGLLKLPPRPENRYSIADIGHFLESLSKAARKVQEVSEDRRTPGQIAFLSFYGKVRERLEEVNQNAFAKVPSADYKIFRIENDQVLSLLGLAPRSATRYRYALTEFIGRLKDFYEKAHEAKLKTKENRTLYEAKVVELANRLETYLLLVNGSTPMVMPPVQKNDLWRAFAVVSLDEPAVGAFEKGYTAILESYSKGDVAGFNYAVKAYAKIIEQSYPEFTSVAALEADFNEASPFFHCQHLYMLVFLFGCLSWMAWSESFRKAGLYLAILTFAVHTAALIIRMYIQGRPPVTNLYSSAIFIGWGAVLTGIVLDFIYKNGVGVASAGLNGYLTLMVAHYLSLNGDTLENLQAVLDTNFWLATHVTTVTFGYTACFLAGAIAATYIVLGVFTPMMNAERTKAMNKMLYGVVCFGMMLSFVGTVLGGIWADQSWGRFWGWDPKENGALLIVLWCALILHARWGGMIKLRGMALLAVFGNVITAWSWFGTNMLGVGLHSYGFVPEQLIWMALFVGSQLMLIAVGSIPMNLWRSYYKPPTSPREMGPSPKVRFPAGAGV